MNERSGPDAREGAVLVSRAIVAMRWVIVVGWIVAAVAVALTLPALGGSGDLELPLPDDAAPLAAEAALGRGLRRAPHLPDAGRREPARRPLGGRPGGARAAFALDVSRHRVPGLEEIAAAVPITSAGGVAPGARPGGPASVITYLAFADQRSIARQTHLGEDYIAAAPIPAGATAGLTGSSAARQQQMTTIDDWMPLVVTITLALIALLVGLVFRSVVAPLVVLGTVAIAYVVDLHVIGGRVRRDRDRRERGHRARRLGAPHRHRHRLRDLLPVRDARTAARGRSPQRGDRRERPHVRDRRDRRPHHGSRHRDAAGGRRRVLPRLRAGAGADGPRRRRGLGDAAAGAPGHPRARRLLARRVGRRRCPSPSAGGGRRSRRAC